eukprot:CAMPEP_0168535930 /NCGR_PEP_ID=MMETSP0405-20121227/19139_1 /TAXON_ID=498012 /ORGANISM="Trichosphaerium sp, Strain Am-I-7 wt" /LENGTH=257 /DNA_ID=CAMNT_0008563623 /DNA_START=1 /DNA_END=771 /DNA_ORIENTATION=+
MELGAASGTETQLLPTRLASLITDKQHYNKFNPKSLLYYHKNVGMILGWNVILEYLDKADAKGKDGIGGSIRKHLLINKFLSCLFSCINLKQYTAETEAQCLALASNAGLENTLALIARMTYLRAVNVVPSLFRFWYNALNNRKVVGEITKYTTDHVSRYLFVDEVKKVEAYESKEGFFDVKATKKFPYKIIASYEKDDVVLKMEISIPASYPLKPPSVALVKRIGVSDQLWRRWTLSMTTLLLTRDGSILDAALLW